MPTIRIIVADAQELVADGLRYRLSEERDLCIVAHVGTGKELLDLLKDTPADLVMLDVSLPGMDGIDTARMLRKKHPKVKVLAHSMLDGIEYVNSMLIEGGAGYLLKNSPKADLLEAVRRVMDGQRYLSPAVRASLEKGYKFTEKRPEGEYIGLTEREREIIRMIAQERTNDEIATALHVSTDTVKTHRKNLMTKLNVRSAAGLVRYAVDRCWT
jgi:two-component system nitrate/nitrite response regulator NarL